MKYTMNKALFLEVSILYALFTFGMVASAKSMPSETYRVSQENAIHRLEEWHSVSTQRLIQGR